MIGKIFKHLLKGDLIYISKNYLKNISVQKRIVEWRKVKAKGEPITIEIANGLKLKLYTDSVLSETIFVGRFENSELEFVSRYLSKGDTFFDIGANVGLFSIMAASKIGAQGNIYAFEPVKKTFSRLKENVELNMINNAKIFNAGLSDSDGFLEMTTSADGFDAWNSFGVPTAGDNFVKESVEIFTLDSWMSNNNVVSANLAKIDVEGWECNVMKGGSLTFSSANAPDLLVEFTEENCKNAGFSCGQLYDVLKNYGYQMFIYDEVTKKIIPEPKRNVYTHMNIVATKNPEAVINRLK